MAAPAGEGGDVFHRVPLLEKELRDAVERLPPRSITINDDDDDDKNRSCGGTKTPVQPLAPRLARCLTGK